MGDGVPKAGALSVIHDNSTIDGSGWLGGGVGWRLNPPSLGDETEPVVDGDSRQKGVKCTGYPMHLTFYLPESGSELHRVLHALGELGHLSFKRREPGI